MINIKCNEKQAIIIEIALDTLSRMSCGQLKECIRGMESMRGKTFPFMEGEIDLQNEYLDKLKKVLFPELKKSEYYGVGNKNIGNSQIAYEMVKVLQNFRTRNLKTAGVLKYKPLHYSKEPLIKITTKNKVIKRKDK